MFRTEYEMSEMVHARQIEVMRGCRRNAARRELRPDAVSARVRVRRAIGHRFVTIGTALVGPL